MVQPINYLAMMPQTNIAAGIEGFGEALQARQKRLAAQETRKQYAADLENAFNNPTQETWAQMIAKYPSQREAFGDVAKMYGADRVANEFRQGAEVSNALEFGSIDVAKNRLATIIEGFKNSGQSPGIYQDVFDLLEKGDVKSAQAAVNMSLALLDPDKFKKVVEGKETAVQEPLKTKRLTAEAIIKEAEAKFAPEKFGLEIDLTRSQIDQAKAAQKASEAAARASGAAAEEARAKAAQIAAGVIPPEKRPDAEGKLRKEYSDATKGYQEVKSAYGRVLASQETAAGDLALIFNYMKMLDPGSVVREGEFATAQNAAGVPDRIKNLYNNLNKGERLNPEQRKMFAKQAEGLFNQARSQEQTVRQGIDRIARGYGLNTENIFYEAVESVPTAPGAPAAPAPAGGGAPAGGVRVTTPTGQVITFPNQQAADAFKRAAGL